MSTYSMSQAIPDAPPEYASPRILDSRRVFGANFFSEHAGAVLEVQCTDERSIEALRIWPEETMRLAGALGWTKARCACRQSGDEARLFLEAPIDGLMTATEVAELAWVTVEQRLGATDLQAGDEKADDQRLRTTYDQRLRTTYDQRLRTTYDDERGSMPRFVEIAQRARAIGRNVTVSDEGLLVGSGVGRIVYAHHATVNTVHDTLQDASHDCPIVLVTGSNGKTTTTRMLAAMCRANGWVTGWSCSDGVWVDDEQLAHGDYSGPGGAWRVLSNPRVQAAVLESARGGMLRRGLAASSAAAAVITNIAADHFGEYGIESLDDLTEVKAIAARALRVGAPLVLNADDPSLVALSRRLTVPVAWFSLFDSALVSTATDATSGYAATVRDGRLLLRDAGGQTDGNRWHDVLSVTDMPISHGGMATHNIANALAAALLARILEIDVAVIRDVLQSFGTAPTDNPGRLVVRSVGGITLLMDYAHNPAGMTSLCRMAAGVPARRRLLLLGQAGDRDDSQLAELATSAWTGLPFDRVIVKEMASMRRGRAAGETAALLTKALIGAGAPTDRVVFAPSEIDGVRQALEWARPGDLLVLGVHASREAVHALVDALATRGWNAGDVVNVETVVVDDS